jgi:hypothetical protein
MADILGNVEATKRMRMGDTSPLEREQTDVSQELGGRADEKDPTPATQIRPIYEGSMTHKDHYEQEGYSDDGDGDIDNLSHILDEVNLSKIAVPDRSFQSRIGKSSLYAPDTNELGDRSTYPPCRCLSTLPPFSRICALVEPRPNTSA